jgi:hypothetical protein
MPHIQASAGDFDFDSGEDLTGEDIEKAMEGKSCDSSLIATRLGRNTFFSDGESATNVGKNTFFSDGAAATKLGRNTFLTDGTVATEVCKNTFISGGDCQSSSDAAVLILGEE